MVLCLTPLQMPARAAAQADVIVVKNEASIYFPTSFEIALAAASTTKIETVSLLYGTDSQTCQESSARHSLKIQPGSYVDIGYTVEFKRSGLLPPGASFWWQWEITDSKGKTILTDEKRMTVQDQRHTWQRVSRDGVTVQWYQGSRSMGNMLLNIAVDSMDRLENEMGMRPPGDTWITVYPTLDEVRELLPYATEWVGGVAFPEHSSTIFGFNETSGEAWARSVIPHELAHLVVDRVVFNCRGVYLPTWMNEGLAVYSENIENPADASRVKAALEKGSLPRLRSLESGFSAFSDSASLAYAQSGMVVSYLYQTHGAARMSELLGAVQSGKRIDPALQQVFGFDTDGLEDAWRASLGYGPPQGEAPSATRAIQTPTRVPTLALWTSAVQPTATATETPSPTPTNTPVPTPTPEPAATSTPDPTPTPVPAPAGNPWRSLALGGGLGGSALLLIAFFIIAYSRKNRK